MLRNEGIMFRLFGAMFFLVICHGVFSVFWTWTYGDASEVYNEAYIICAHDVERTDFKVHGTKYDLLPTRYSGVGNWRRNDDCNDYAHEQSLQMMVPPFGWIWKNM
ncbi:MAG: hypothetical protein CMQ41_07650 [Gammaproteobacteria bacterium]|nr:hypothetical protein [Gammaproteobacteria bacterium]